MKARMFVVVVAMCLAIVACGSSGRTSRAKTDELPDRLLTLEDMPAGWSVSNEFDSEDDESDEDDTFCPEAESAMEDQDVDSVEAGFAQGQLGPFVVESIAPGTEDDFDEMVKAMDQCVGSSWTTTDDEGAETTFSMEQLSAGKLGSKSKAYRISGEMDMGLMSIDLVMGTADGAIALLMGLNVTTVLGGSRIPAADFAAIVDVASAKLTA